MPSYQWLQSTYTFLKVQCKSTINRIFSFAVHVIAKLPSKCVGRMTSAILTIATICVHLSGGGMWLLSTIFIYFCYSFDHCPPVKRSKPHNMYHSYNPYCILQHYKHGVQSKTANFIDFATFTIVDSSPKRSTRIISAIPTVPIGFWIILNMKCSQQRLDWSLLPFPQLLIPHQHALNAR